MNEKLKDQVAIEHAAGLACVNRLNGKIESLEKELARSNEELHGYSAMAAIIKELQYIVTSDCESKSDFIYRVKELLSVDPDDRLKNHNAEIIENLMLDSDAKVGAGTFKKGVKWRLVIDADIRLSKYQDSPDS